MAVVPDWGSWEGPCSACSRGRVQSSLELAFFLCPALLPSPPSRRLSPKGTPSHCPAGQVPGSRSPACGTQSRGHMCPLSITYWSTRAAFLHELKSQPRMTVLSVAFLLNSDTLLSLKSQKGGFTLKDSHIPPPPRASPHATIASPALSPPPEMQHEDRGHIPPHKRVCLLSCTFHSWPHCRSGPPSTQAHTTHQTAQPGPAAPWAGRRPHEGCVALSTTAHTTRTLMITRAPWRTEAGGLAMWFCTSPG